VSATIEHLVYMANQIARNLAREHDPVAATAEHMLRFWDHRMKALVSAHVAAGGAGLDAVAADAVRRLAVAAR
jgi:formate dehydrogenase subunit delta